MRTYILIRHKISTWSQSKMDAIWQISGNRLIEIIPTGKIIFRILMSTITGNPSMSRVEGSSRNWLNIYLIKSYPKFRGGSLTRVQVRKTYQPNCQESTNKRAYHLRSSTSDMTLLRASMHHSMFEPTINIMVFYIFRFSFSIPIPHKKFY